MNEKLTSTHIRFIAVGWWERYFRWRLYPKGRAFFLVALICAIAFFGVIIATPANADNHGVDANTEQSEGENEGSPALAIAIIALVVATAISVAIGLCQYFEGKEDYVNAVVARWDAGDKTVPTVETVIGFLKDKGLIER